MTVPCPICKTKTTWEDNPFRPFCSEKCQSRDLGKWADGQYRIPDHEKEDNEKKEEE